MAYDVSNIIQINTFLSSAGLGYANFGSAMLFAPFTEKPETVESGTIRTYSSTSEVAKDFAEGTETYKASAKWLGGIPSSKTIAIYMRKEEELSITASLNAARDKAWWFFTFVTKELLEVKETAKEIADWCEQNSSFFFNNQHDVSATEIRDPDTVDDVASVMTSLGYRFTATMTHAEDPYAGIALAKWFAAVNYSATNSTITGEFKKLSGVAAESLPTTAQKAMLDKKSLFYTVVESSGINDSGRVIGSKTHSTYGEYIDDVINLESFKNQITVDLYNAIAGSSTKVGQDSIGMAVLLGTVRLSCDRFVANGYLGARSYLDPDDGVQKNTIGYEILTQPEEIEMLTDAERAERLSSPIRLRVFRRGAIHKAIIDLYIN